jgi:thioredoxin 1
MTDDRFEKEVLQSPGLKLVDFWAEWCGPCRILAPTIDSLAQEYSGKVGVHKLDVDANPQTAAKYGIRGIPTVLFFKDGQLVDQVVGAQPKEVFVQKISKFQAAQ